MRWLKDLLARGFVLELWQDGRKFHCLATRGSEPGRKGQTHVDRDPRRAAEGAVSMLTQEELEST